MGRGYYTTLSANTYTKSAYNVATTDGLSNLSYKEVFRETALNKLLDPKNVIRESCNSDDHPHVLPIILGTDTTGSMGHAAVMTLAKLNETMEEVYKVTDDVAFCLMGIGDFECDGVPFQVTQFESDVRILEQSSLIYLPMGGGGNGYESYTSAWWFGLNRCKLDCWNEGRKGIILTCGDEPLNPTLPIKELQKHFGGEINNIVETNQLYQLASEKFDIYHIAITDESSYSWHKDKIEETWRPLLGDNLIIAESTQLPQIISAIVNGHTNSFTTPAINEDGISW